MEEVIFTHCNVWWDVNPHIHINNRFLTFTIRRFRRIRRGYDISKPGGGGG